LPTPAQYEPRWPAMKAMDELQRVEVAKNVALMNQAQGEDIVTVNEIRDYWLDLPPIEEVLSPEELAARNAPPPVPPIPAPTPQIAAARRAAKWRHLSISAKVRYLAKRRIAQKRRAQQTPIVVTEVPIPSEERALTAALTSALSREDRELAETLIRNAL